MNIKYSIPDNAEVISSIGVALAMVRDVVERVVPNPTPQDIRNIRAEVINKAIESGASPDTIDVHIEIDSNTSRLIAIATGSTEVKSTDLLKECSEFEAKELASEDMGISKEEVCLIEKNQIRIVDKKGFIKVQRNSGSAFKVKAEAYKDAVKSIWGKLTVYKSDSVLRPDFYLCIGPRVMDFASGSDFEQMLMIMDVSVQMADPKEEILIIGAKNEI